VDPQRFSTRLAARPKGGFRLELPFDPATAWGSRLRFHVAGSVAGHPVRGEVTSDGGGPALELGPSWCRDPRMVDGLQVDVELDLEGPAMPDDLAAELSGEPGARSFFEALPSFYRKNFVRSIDTAKRPETRARRVAAIAAALRDGRREVGG
jgi:Bacteriocin-protection, YdeI or OmpD-Associated/Domain of unknown function (DUF1905)